VGVSIHRQRRRLKRAFQAALLAVGSPTIVIACTSSIPSLTSSPAPEDAGEGTPLDATQTDDTGRPDAPNDAKPDAHDATPEAEASALPLLDASVLLEAGPGAPNGCFLRAYELDAGPDADAAGDLCGYDYGSCGLAANGLASLGCQVLDLLGDGEVVPIPQMSCWLGQGQGCDDDAYAPGEGGALTIYCSCPTAGGRRPAGLCKPKGVRRPSVLGTYLASLEFEEGASVVAFERMQEELTALGAPAALVAEAARAARDEARHVRAMESLARATGTSHPAPRTSVAPAERPRVRRLAPRSVAAIAAENAAEGCVRETYGALVARWQSAHAGNPEVRRTFARIAVDEARHAALSWTVATWIAGKLDPAAQRRVARSQSRALRTLQRVARVEPPRELVQSAGLPAAHEARALLDVLGRELGLVSGSLPPRLSRAARRRSRPLAAPSP
jgi:hypothetical protein